MNSLVLEITIDNFPKHTINQTYTEKEDDRRLEIEEKKKSARSIFIYHPNHRNHKITKLLRYKVIRSTICHYLRGEENLNSEQNREKNSYLSYGYAPAPLVVGRSDHEKVGPLFQ